MKVETNFIMELIKKALRIHPPTEEERILFEMVAEAYADLIVTLTGDINVVSPDVIENLKDGAIVANSGHFNVEINTNYLKDASSSVKRIRDVVDIYKMKNGKEVILLAEGRLVNLSAAEGHPSMVMDMSFANQFLSIIRLAKEDETLPADVYEVPIEQDEEIARIKLETMKIKIDTLTKEQSKYIEDYSEGT
jgi:adenosylhomocysteinase